MADLRNRLSTPFAALAFAAIAAFCAVTMGETPKPPAQPVTMGETPKPPAQPVTMGETARA